MAKVGVRAKRVLIEAVNANREIVYQVLLA
jgi:hypothetical protein